MCGHVGMVGTIVQAHEKAFKNMLVLDSVRGEHSTGAASIARHTDHLVVKAVGDPFVLFDTAGFNKVMSRVNKALIGHNRFATSGTVSRNNAHPFQFDHIIGAHNGTLSNKGGLHEGYSFNVDSQALFNHIERFGVQDAVNKTGGSWALTWWDQRDETMNFLRNKERPLYGAFSEDEKTLFWASEQWMIYVASNRNDIKVKDAFLFEENMHYKMKPGMAGSILPAFDVEEVKSSYIPFVSTGTTTAFTKVVPGVKQGVKVQEASVVQIGNKNDILSNKKGLSFRIIGKNQDFSNNLYAICKGPETPFQVRLYLKNEEEYNEIKNQTIKADVGVLFSNPSSGYFYKLVYSSYTIDYPEVVAAEVEEEFKGKNGDLMDKESWNAKYGECQWCSGFVNHSLGFKFARYTDVAVCHECMNDDEVLQYV